MMGDTQVIVGAEIILSVNKGQHYNNTMLYCYSHYIIIVTINTTTSNYLNILLEKYDRCAFVDMVLNICHNHEVILKKTHTHKLTIFDYLATVRMTICIYIVGRTK